MAYHQNPPLATAIPIPASGGAAGEYSLSRKSTDVDESQIRALKGQGYTIGELITSYTKNKYVELDPLRMNGIFLSCSQLLPA